MALAPYIRPSNIYRGVAERLRAPRRIRPSEAVEKYLRTEKGAWNPDLASMMIEPLDLLMSRGYTGIVYVGPARGSKTMTLILGAMTYIVTCSPGDMQITQMSQDMAREFSKKEIDRAIRYSPALQARLSPRPRDDNVFDKFFRSGMALNLAWPTVTQHSSKTLKYTLITDYDRPENRDDVDGEGTLWDVAYARIRTYMSRGKCLAESSPGGEYLDPKWRSSAPHEAPPATGILSIYNRGTRARWYWPCMHCQERFEAKPGLDCFKLPPFEELEQEVQKRDLMWLAEQFAHVACPHCGGLHEIENKPQLNLGGRWVHAGETIDPNGIITGERRRTDIASFWQGGVSASYQRWDQLLLRYFQGIQAFTKTGDEGSLKATTNTDQAAPYLPRSVAKKRGAEELMQRVEDWPQGVVPRGVKFLTAACDVQAHRFEIRVFGWGIGLESWIVARYAISSSKRPEGDRYAALDPAGFSEDWDLLIDELVHKTYPVQDFPDVRMPIHFALCDSGGKDGVTTRAYEFWRRLRAAGFHKRLMLLKGDRRINIPQTQLTWPDAKERKDRKAGGRGDVPVWLLNVNLLKDTVANDLARDVVGPGYHHIPDWIPDDYFDQIVSETRTEKGWTDPQSGANEDWDLHVYNRACCVIIRAHAIDWDHPPAWARGVEGLPRLNRQAVPVKPTVTAVQRRRVRSSGVQV